MIRCGKTGTETIRLAVSYCTHFAQPIISITVTNDLQHETQMINGDLQHTFEVSPGVYQSQAKEFPETPDQEPIRMQVYPYLYKAS